VLTSCCRQPVEGVLIYCNGRRAGVTSFSGTLKLALPPGDYIIAAPGQCRKEVRKKVARGNVDAASVELPTDGELFVFLQDMNAETEEVAKNDSVMISACKKHIPGSARCFEGTVSVLGKRATNNAPQRSKGFMPLASLDAYTPCGDALKSLRVEPSVSDGAHYERNEDANQWLQDLTMQGECAMARLFRMPLRHGNLHHGMTVAIPSTEDKAKGNVDGMFFMIKGQTSAVSLEVRKKQLQSKSSSTFWQTSMLMPSSLKSDLLRPSSATVRPASAPSATMPGGTTSSTVAFSPSATRRWRPQSSPGGGRIRPSSGQYIAKSRSGQMGLFARNHNSQKHR